MLFKIYEEIDEFLEQATEKTQKLIIKKLRLFEGREKRDLERSEDLKCLVGNIYEIIIGPWRLLGSLVGAVLHLTVIFRKQSKKTPARYIKRALARGKEIK